MYGKKLLKQRLDFRFQNKFETIDIIPKMHGQKTAQTTVFHLKTRLKLWIAWLKCTAQKIVETTVRFFI